MYHRGHRDHGRKDNVFSVYSVVKMRLILVWVIAPRAARLLALPLLRLYHPQQSIRPQLHRLGFAG